MFGFLRALGLNPPEWSKAVLMAKGANPYVDDVLDDAMGRVQAVIVLLSPDEEAKLKGEFYARTEKRTEGRLGGQPRPNVIFEAGQAMDRHPEKTLLVARPGWTLARIHRHRWQARSQVDERRGLEELRGEPPAQDHRQQGGHHR